MIKVICTSRYCPKKEKCLRCKYEKSVFERIDKVDLTNICEINNYVNFKENKDEN